MTKKDRAYNSWARCFGDKTEAVDFAGRTIRKEDFGKVYSEYGWNIDHIIPKSKGGSGRYENLICVHVKTNEEKKDDESCFEANNRLFQIERIDQDLGTGKFIGKIFDKKSENEKTSHYRYWDKFFGEGKSLAYDFAGRQMIKSQFEKEPGSGGWYIDYFVAGDQRSENIYIANAETIADRKGRNTFEANGGFCQYKRSVAKNGLKAYIIIVAIK